MICIGIFGSLVIALLGFVYFSTISYIQKDLDRSISVEQRSLLKIYEGLNRDKAVAILKERIAGERLTGTFFIIVDSSFRKVAGDLDEWPQGLEMASGWKAFTLADGSAARAAVISLPDGNRLMVGKKMVGEIAFTSQIKAAFVLVIAFILLLAGAASIAITRRTIGRIETINATMKAIMRSGLGERIPGRETGDEWDQLTFNLNAMLDRIERLVDEVKEVSDNVAHDLRTPLARIRGWLEQAQDGPRNIDDDQMLIERTILELDGVLRMFTALTRISRIEANAPSKLQSPVDLVRVATDVAELFDAASEQDGGHLTVVGDATVLVAGDRDLLFDALANLVDNAIKHGRKGGTTQVEVREEHEGALIAVSDDGPGIPSGESNHVLKRFYRLESSRHTPGNGLGLSLVAAVARFHDLEMEMADNTPGLIVRLRFPVRASARGHDGLTRETCFAGGIR